VFTSYLYLSLLVSATNKFAENDALNESDLYILHDRIYKLKRAISDKSNEV